MQLKEQVKQVQDFEQKKKLLVILIGMLKVLNGIIFLIMLKITKLILRIFNGFLLNAALFVKLHLD